MVCRRCGQELPRDDARFCNNCGMAIAPFPESPASPRFTTNSEPSSTQSSRPPVVAASDDKSYPQLDFPQQSYRHVLREQIAHQPRPARLTKRIAFEDMPTSAQTSVDAPKPAVSPTAHSPLPSLNQDASLALQSEKSERPALRVRVWNQNDAPRMEADTPDTQRAIDDLPTQETPTSSSVSNAPPLSGVSVVSAPSTPPASLPLQEEERRREQIEQQSTTPLESASGTTGKPDRASSSSTPHTIGTVSQPVMRETPFFGIQGVPPFSSLPSTSSTKPSQSNFEERQQPVQSRSSFAPIPATPVLQQVQPVQPVQPIQRHSPHTPNPDLQATSTRASSVSTGFAQSPRSVRRSPAPLVLFCLVLLALIIAGGAWVVLAQPFNVPAVTKPLQAYRDASLALSYPSDWSVTHHDSATVFSDSTQTAQVTVTILPATSVAGGDVVAFLQKQVAKAGMTGPKAVTPVQFAGTTWQQVRGNVQVQGVNETEGVFATLRNDHVYMLTQTAPQSVYNDEESIVFSKMRASLQLL